MDWWSRFRLKRRPTRIRAVRGTPLRGAKQVAIVYQHRDEAQFRRMRQLAERLVAESGVERVVRLAYVPFPEKALPHYFFQKRDEMYLSEGHLDRWKEAKGNAGSFLDVDWDLLICLEPEPTLPLDYLCWKSLARMKVGSARHLRPQDFDVLFVPKMGETSADFSHRLIQFLLDAPMVVTPD